MLAINRMLQDQSESLQDMYLINFNNAPILLSDTEAYQDSSKSIIRE